MATLFTAGGLLLAQEQPGGATISITVSNQSDVSAILGVLEVPTPLLPPSLAAPSLTPRRMPSQAEARTEAAHPMYHKQTTIQPNQSAVLDLRPGPYMLEMMPLPRRGKMLAPLRGYISVTNAEVWLLKLEREDKEDRGPSWGWKVEVPSRPGFHLSPHSDLEALKLPANALRPQPAPALLDMPRLPRPPLATNSAGLHARLTSGSDALAVYGSLTGKTVLMASGLPRLPDSIIAGLPADKTNAVARIERALSEQGVEVVQDGPNFVRNFRREARESLTNSPLRGAELAPAYGQESAAPGMINFGSADLNQVLELYVALSQRTVLRPATLPAPTINLLTRNRLTLPEVVYAIATVLALNGICLADDGAKFVQAVPMAQRAEVKTSAPKPEPGAELMPAGSINLSGADLHQALAIYAAMRQRTILHPATLPRPTVSLKTQSALTREEASYAMEKVLELNGISVVDDGAKFVQAVPRVLRVQVKTNAPKPEPGAKLFDPEKVPALGFAPIPSPQTEADRNAAQRLLEFYADLAGKTAVPEPQYEQASIWFYISTPLSKSDLLYAIETTFALNGFAIIPVDDNRIRLGRLSSTGK